LLATFATGEFASVLSPARLVVPVPLHSARHRQRGYNQADLLAAPVAEALGLALVHHLVRQRPTPPQVGLGRESRRRNLVDAFSWTGPALEGVVVLVVDDVITTGATLAEVAATLTAAGATGVIGLALAREP
jgi:ComF family protein